MATYTAAELKDLTSVSAVSVWSSAKILLKQTTAESVLAGLGMDTTAVGYVEAYAAAVIMVFDWLADNPTGRESESQGKVSKDFTVDDLPGPIRHLLSPFIRGGEGGAGIVGARFQRREIGLR
jgi:hypothetical protein